MPPAQAGLPGDAAPSDPLTILAARHNKSVQTLTGTKELCDIHKDVVAVQTAAGYPGSYWKEPDYAAYRQLIGVAKARARPGAGEQLAWL